ncbi:MAG: 16S rRNA (guanine(966)-N(2))-methyltransferase RsmD [Ruminococcaceae bacterium]|nr:16S rRNA (guanine(966)-N(2))-methyltransferase RsmD [Oscillospiraceae bacterium]
MMRIITGTAKGVKLATLSGDNTRPTSERAKEAVFSMLQFDLAGRRVLDLFSGSGQMGLEALSRGAAKAVLVDKERAAVDVITQNATKTRLLERAEIRRADALSYLSGYRGEPFHLVFLDPPYALGLIPQCLSLLLSRNLLTPGAVVVCEAGSFETVFAGDEALAARFDVLRESRYGVAFVTLISPKQEGC